jgi:hypothetical protein
VVIAGSTEASGEHCAYAINMVDVCRTISIGMGNVSVHVPTPIENAIATHNVVHKGRESRDTAELAALLIKQLVFEVAQGGSTTSPFPNAVFTSGPIINSLLALARVCPLVRPDRDKDPILERMSAWFWGDSISPFSGFFDLLFSLSIHPGMLSGANLWYKLHKYDASLNMDGLFLIVRSVGPGLTIGDLAKLIQRTMLELGIFPRPNLRQLSPVVQSLRWRDQISGNRITIASVKGSVHGFPRNHNDELFPVPGLMADIPKILARLLYAASVHEFFVYCGAFGQWLCGLSEVVELGIIMVHPEFGGASLVSQARDDEHWASQIRAFVIPEDQLEHYSKEPGTQFSKYGVIVGHSELRSLLWRLENCESSWTASPQRDLGSSEDIST